MQQHAVPQNITGFQFKLVGFLTLRQFSVLAGAGVISFLIFVSSGGFFKWLLITPLMGAALLFAFVPVNGMTFDRWLYLLFMAVITPSRRIWHKEPKIIGYFGPEFTYYLHRSLLAKPKEKRDRTRLDSLLTQIREREKVDHLDILETGKTSVSLGEQRSGGSL